MLQDTSAISTYQSHDTALFNFHTAGGLLLFAQFFQSVLADLSHQCIKGILHSLHCKTQPPLKNTDGTVIRLKRDHCDGSDKEIAKDLYNTNKRNGWSKIIWFYCSNKVNCIC